jgi:hypothetical protein
MGDVLMGRAIVRDGHEAGPRPSGRITSGSSRETGGPPREGGDIDMSDIQPLTQRQIRCLEGLAEEYEVVSLEEGPPIVRAPNGALLRVKANGRIVALVETVQSYLHVHG